LTWGDDHPFLNEHFGDAAGDFGCHRGASSGNDVA
jgi:hypothetical protein